MKPCLLQYTIALQQLGGTAYGRKKSAGLSTFMILIDTVAIEIYTEVIVGSVRCVEESNLRLSGGLGSIFEVIPIVWGAFLKLFLYTRWQK